MTIWTPGRYLVLFALAMTIGMVGCGGSLPPKADPDTARKTLAFALESWANGKTAESLSARQPAIYFNDLKADQKLASFVIADGHEMYGQSVRLTATLTFKRPDGSTVDRKITYLIDTSPALVIVQG